MLFFIGASLGALFSNGSPQKALMGTTSDADSLDKKENAQVCVILSDMAKRVQNAPKTEFALRSIIQKLENFQKLNRNDQVFLMELSRRVNNAKLSGLLVRIAQKY